MATGPRGQFGGVTGRGPVSQSVGRLVGIVGTFAQTSTACRGPYDEVIETIKALFDSMEDC